MIRIRTFTFLHRPTEINQHHSVVLCRPLAVVVRQRSRFGFQNLTNLHTYNARRHSNQNLSLAAAHYRLYTRCVSPALSESDLRERRHLRIRQRKIKDVQIAL